MRKENRINRPYRIHYTTHTHTQSIKKVTPNNRVAKDQSIQFGETLILSDTQVLNGRNLGIDIHFNIILILLLFPYLYLISSGCVLRH